MVKLYTRCRKSNVSGGGMIMSDSLNEWFNVTSWFALKVITTMMPTLSDYILRCMQFTACNYDN